jgi:hypothetical protein
MATPAPQAPATGIILGQAVDGVSGQPISGATVSIGGAPSVADGQLAPGGDPALLEAISRANGATRVLTSPLGQFVFHDLQRGSYRLTAAAPGYVPGSFGQHRVNDASRPITLDDGERVGDATIKLWKYATVSGRVVDDAGEPVVLVAVRVLRTQVVGARRSMTAAGQVQTDDRGMYRISTLVPGSYVVAVPQTISTIPLAVADAYATAIRSGGSESNVLSMELNASGAPFPGLSGLRVGDQQMQALNGRPGITVSSDSRLLAYQTQFYPSAANSTDATVLTLAPGQEQSGIDLQTRLVPTVRISGTVSGPDGPSRTTGVRLLPITAQSLEIDNGFETAVTATDYNGAFVFPAVPSGQYVVRVQRIPRPVFDPGTRVMVSNGSGFTVSSFSSDAAPAPPPAEPALFGEAPITIAERDVSDVNVVLRPGARVSGRYVFEGTGTPPDAAQLQRLQPALQGVDSRILAVTSGRVNADGTFTTQGYPPGRYFVNAAAPALGRWTLESATLGARNLDDAPLELQDADISGVVLTFTTQPTDVRGNVRGAMSGGQSSDVDATIVVIPANYTSWMDHGMTPRRMRTASAGKTGAFSIGTLPPGEYLAAAIPSGSLGELRDPKFVEAIARIGTHFTLSRGDQKVLDLPIGQIR